MAARESQLASDVIPGDLSRLLPICTDAASDSASFDEVLELLHLGGRSLPHAVLMMIPEAWENHTEMDPARRAFYEFHAALMEPWDGPACITFTDGSLIGAVLDRNGLRPSRYWVTEDGLVVLASEVGVLDLDPATVVRKGRLQPGRMFLVDTDRGRIVDDAEIKAELAAEAPYDEWLHAGQIHLADLPEREHVVHTHASVTRRQQTFGYTEEELRILLTPMARNGAEPIGSMGTDTPIAVLSAAAAAAVRLLQPAVRPGDQPAAGRDPRGAGHQPRHGDRPGPEPAHRDAGALPAGGARLPGHRQRRARQDHPHQPRRRPARLRGRPDPRALPGRRRRAGAAVGAGGHLRRGVRGGRRGRALHRAVRPRLRRRVGADPVAAADQRRAPPPDPGATRTQVGLVVEAGDVREVHHVALLIGYGASAVNPYLAMESVEDLARARPGRAASSPSRPCATSSRRSARACSR